jgi:mannose/fructose/N-acetylgalactosamine-specific phosphotransferase system component IIC
MPDILLIALVAGLLAIDDRAGWQSLLGEPIFSSLIVGVLLGAIEPALQCGVVLQLAWLSIGAARGTRRPNTVVGGVVGAGAVSLVLAANARANESLVVATGVLMGLAAAEVGALIGRAVGELRERWLGDFTLPASYEVASRKLAMTVLGSTVFVGLVDFVVVLLLLPLAASAARLSSAHFGTGAATGAAWWLSCVAAIGIASIMRAFGTRVLVRFLAAGAAAVALVGWLR